MRLRFGLILILTAGLCLPISVLAQTSAPPAKKASHHKAKPKPAKAAKKEEPPPKPAAALPPPTPEELPSQPPTVVYQNGQLEITAPNSTLSDILHAVHNKTGAVIDFPPGANERVVSSFGPGPARDVLASLLNGTHFNYVMVGTEKDPTSVAQVILTPRTGGETPPMVQASRSGMPMQGQPQMQPQFPQPYPPQAQGNVPQQEAPPSDGMEEDDSSQDNTAVDNGVNQGAPEQVQGNEAQGQNPNQPVVKTPEQLLQELQRQQQIMQQQQQGQQGQQPQPPPPQVLRPNPQNNQQQPQ